MHAKPDIKSLLQRVFAARNADELFQLLGFAEPRMRIGALSQSLEVLIDTPLTVFSRGTRSTLACFEISTDQQLQNAELARVARALRTHNYAQLQLCVVIPSDFTRITIATYALGEHLLTLSLQCEHVHAADVETLQEMLPAEDERGSALAARHARALDRTRVTGRFFADFAAQRDQVAATWSGIPAQARRDREQLALLLLSRLMFLYFLQHRGYLGGDTSYLVRRLRAWHHRRTFYRAALTPLFFRVLNRRPERRPPSVRVFGDLPYLNGGLFERLALERKHPRHDLHDSALAAVFDHLLERYRFTAHEVADAQIAGVHDVGVDPEMLGRVFEGLMAPRVRETTGTFYTPAATVDRLVCNALIAHAEPRVGSDGAIALLRDGAIDRLDSYQRRNTSKLLRDTRILDPACGSGAFLLGSLARVARARAALDDTGEMSIRRDVVARSLFGVDLQSDAALLCALRLWLALVPGREEQVQPLPNLDRQIRQGDSLVDPLDLRRVAANPAIRDCMRQLQPASEAYVISEPDQRQTIRRALLRAEQRLARAWIDTHLKRITHDAAELKALAQQSDLFGALTPEARTARRELRVVHHRAGELSKLRRDIRRKDERPFFSYGVHFPEATLQGFDIVLCNPPWVRSHNWPRTITGIIRQRFRVCRDATWRPPGDRQRASGGGMQIDLALLFLERSLELLAPEGVLGIILPAKFMRSPSGASARKLLLEQADIVSIEDHSLDQRSIFAADAFASVIIARKRSNGAPSSLRPIEVTAIKRGGPPLQFRLVQRDLPLIAADTRAPWLLVPPDMRRVLLRMQEAPALGMHATLRVRRGVVTGNNAVMILTRADRKLSGLTEIRAEGAQTAPLPGEYEGIVESETVRPLLRGADVGAWTWSQPRFLLCRPSRASTSLPRLTKYLARHGRTISDVPKVDPPTAFMAWHDLANTLKAVVVPRDIVPLNTVYYIALDDDLAYLLCAYFNSLPLRTFARAIAERAKDAHFRFFAWTVSLLPLPAHWRAFEADRLQELSRSAHRAGALPAEATNELDSIVARAYGLTRADLRSLAGFDGWLRPT